MCSLTAKQISMPYVPLSIDNLEIVKRDSNTKTGWHSPGIHSLVVPITAMEAPRNQRGGKEGTSTSKKNTTMTHHSHCHRHHHITTKNNTNLLQSPTTKPPIGNNSSKSPTLIEKQHPKMESNSTSRKNALTHGNTPSITPKTTPPKEKYCRKPPSIVNTPPSFGKTLPSTHLNQENIDRNAYTQ